ncbi:MAG: hypothetical protein V4719_10910 [Planctomycetota bacterium]
MSIKRLTYSQVCLSAIGLTIVTLYVLSFWATMRGFQQFLGRTSEVDKTIQDTYLYYYKNAAWPESTAALERASGTSLPAEWTYDFIGNEADSTARPVLRIRGPMHLKLQYEFRHGGLLTAPGGWSARCEGDRLKVTSLERIPERPSLINEATK